MYIDKIKECILSVPNISDYKEFHDFINRAVEKDSLKSWDYVFLSCEAVGGVWEDAVPLAAANFCLLISIHLVDDMLDNDPKGYFQKFGTGTAANLALAIQATAIYLIQRANLSYVNYGATVERLSQMMMMTSAAQQADIVPATNEAGYWNNVAAKSPPLFTAALYTGALSGGCDLSTAEVIASIGRPIGIMIQIGDDLSDVFNDHIGPDWLTRFNNLPILYAMTANYDERDHFLALIKDIEAPGNLQAAQKLLIKSGAVSYCVYHLMELNKQINNMIDSLKIVKPERLREIAASLIQPAMQLLQHAK